MKTLQVAIGICSLLLIATVGLYGQIAPGANADAIHPAGPPDPQKIDAVWQVDPISDQVTINIPFTTTPQGGRGPKIPFSLLYNSGSTVTLQALNSFVVAGATSTIYDWSTQPISGSSTAPSGPWTTTGPYIYYSISSYPPVTLGGQTYSGCTIDGPYIYVDENGSAHDMNLISLIGVSPGALVMGTCASAESWTSFSSSSSTTDGSTIATSFSGTAPVIGPDGTSAAGSFESGSGPITPATTTLTDPNGNSATLALSHGTYTATDALGRTVYTTTIPIGIGGQIEATTPETPYTLTTYSESGTTETYKIFFSQEAISSFTMQHPTGAEIGVNTSVNPPDTGTPRHNTFTAVTEIELPDSTSYQFAYDATYGTISKITFPTGGYVRFCWGVRDKDWTGDGSIEVISSVVAIAAFTSTGSGTPGSCGATPTAGSNENQWTYALESLDNSPTPIGQVTAPDGSVTKYTGTCSFDFTAVSLFGGKLSCKESSRAIYDSGGNLKMSVAQSFNSQGLPTQVATTFYDGTSPLQKQTVNYYDGYNNVIEKDESDYYTCSGTPCAIPTTQPAWIRSTYTSYNSTLAAAHIVNKPSQVAVTNGAGSSGGGTIPNSVTPYSLTNYTYDTHGNLTGETKCTSISGTGASATCASSWSTSFYNDPTGQLTCKIDGPGLGSNQVGSCPAAGLATTSYTWGGQANGYLHTVTNPNSATDSYTYFESTTGQVETHKDWNQNQTTYDYTDSLNRIHTITAPATTDGTTGTSGQGLTTYTYTDTPGEFAVQEQHLITGTTQTSVTKSYDGLGRLETSSTVIPISQCSTGASVVQTTYDSMSRIYTVSNPFCTTTDPTYGLTTYAYDALSRKVKTTNADTTVSTITYGGNATEFTDPPNSSGDPQHIQQVNGLGQLTNVCEVTTFTFGATAPANCGLNVAGTGYLTAYSYDPLNNLLSVSQHGISRSFSYDSLSRLTYALNPEAGAVSYAYLTSGSAHCAPDPAVPCSKTDARGVTISYGYDNLSRLLSKTYSYSSNNSSTPISCYQYDAGTGTNPKGHLTNAWTQQASSVSCNSSLTSFINLKSFVNYDAVGRLLNATQQTCINGTCTGPSAYQVSMSYDLLGDTTALTNSVGANNQSLTLTDTFDVAAHPCLTTSNWTANASPNIFQINPSSPGYSPAGGLQNYYLGSTSSSALTSCATSPASPINVVLGYNKRFWVNSISATGQIP